MNITFVTVGKIKEKYFRDAVAEYQKRLSKYCIALTIDGKKRDSVNLAAHIEQLGLSGKSHLVFVIGGSLGLHESVTQRADETLSFSDMTFPHQLMRVILLEQIYRCFRILNGEPYHK